MLRGIKVMLIALLIAGLFAVPAEAARRRGRGRGYGQVKSIPLMSPSAANAAAWAQYNRNLYGGGYANGFYGNSGRSAR